MISGLFAFGSNGSGQLGIGNFLDCNVPTPCKFSKKADNHISDDDDSFASSLKYPPKVISCGGNHSALITYNGELWMTGSNVKGQCGNIVINDDNLFYNCFHQVLTDKKWKHVACGWTFTILVEENGNVYALGKGSFGELGCGKNV